MNPSTIAPALRFRGQKLSAQKHFWGGTERVVSPAETLARIRPAFKRVGLTRLADITGLDRIPIHTVLAIRPNAGYLACDAGKGVTLEAAQASAAMESMERFVAETVEVEAVTATYEEVAAQGPVMALDDLPLTRNSVFSPRRPERWAYGWDIVQEEEVAVPADLVPMQRYQYTRRDLASFQTGSNGLASGNVFPEALASGLSEVIERDATSCWRTSMDRGGMPRRVRLETIHSPVVGDVLHRLRSAGVQPILFDCTVDTRLPVYMAYIYDQQLRHVGLFRGYGAHLSPEVAMARAITEAVQGRVVYVAGSRDDLYKVDYTILKKGDDSRTIQALEEIPASLDATELHSTSTPTFEGDVATMIEGLRAAGLDRVIVFDLSRPELPVAVVRVIVPGLEGYVFDYYRPGRRALAFTGRPVS